MLNTSTKSKEPKETKKKSKQLKVVSIDLIEQIKEKDKLEKERLELEKDKLEKDSLEKQKASLEKQKAETALNNIDLRYFANQNVNPSFKTNKLEQLLSNNYLLKDIYDNIEENIATYKEQIIKYNETTLEKLIETSNKTASGEKYKLYYLLYVLNLIVHLKEKKIKNSIKEELKDFNNNSYNNYSADTSLNDFNLYNTTLNSMCTKKQITNLDLFVVRKTTNAKRKILPQKRD